MFFFFFFFFGWGCGGGLFGLWNVNWEEEIDPVKFSVCVYCLICLIKYRVEHISWGRRFGLE